MHIKRLVFAHNKDGVYTPDNIVKGKPTAMVNNLYSDTTGAFSTGVWSSEPGKWSFEQVSSEEFCYLLTGKVKLVHVDGTEESFKEGDAFVIPIGFKGTWETIEPVNKFYAVYERNKIPSKL